MEGNAADDALMVNRVEAKEIDNQGRGEYHELRATYRLRSTRSIWGRGSGWTLCSRFHENHHRGEE